MLSATKYKLLLLLFVYTSINAQQGWWTWMHGTNAPVPSGNWGVIGVPAASNEPPAFYKTDACWKDSQGNFWFFGGDQGHAALWKYNIGTNIWTWMKGPNTTNPAPVFGTKGVPNIANNPPPLMLGGLTWTDAQDNLWMFGGNMGSYGDMWKYNPATNMWTWMHGPGVAGAPGNYGTQGVPAPGNYPPPRYETSASWVDNSGNLWLFGGGTSMGQMNDMWKYDPTTNQWTWMKGPNTSGNLGNYGTKGIAAPGNNPPARWAYCRWTDNNGNFWLFGGSGVNNNSNGYNDLWKFDPSTNNWTWISGSNLLDQQPAYPQKCIPSVNNAPQARYENHVSWKDECGNLWLYSGQWTAASGGQNKSDVWCYKIQTNEWVYVSGNVTTSLGTKGVPAGSNFPGDVYGAGAFTHNNEFYFFGGRINGGGNANLLWKYIPDSSCAQSYCKPQTTNPTANFNGANLIGCAPLTVTFTNTSTNATTYTWDFGDGSGSNQQHPSHTYTTSGMYTVQLIVSNGTSSDTLTYTQYVNVVAPATANITPNNDDTLCVGTTLNITNNSTNANSYFWSIPGLVKDTTTNFSYTFTTPGTYTIYFAAYNQFGCNDFDTINIVIVTGFQQTQNITICSGSTYTLPGGNIVSQPGTYIDTLSGGGSGCDSIITTVLSVTQAFNVTVNAGFCSGNTYTLPGGTIVSQAGVYIDTLNSAGGCDSIITTTLSQYQNPVIAISSIPSCSGNNGSATANVSSGTSPYQYLWSNGQTSATATGLTQGNYTVIVIDSKGCSDTATVNISSASGPTVSTSTTTNVSCFGGNNGSASVNASSGTAPYSYSWSPGGYTTSAVNTLSANNYTVTVTDANGCTATQTISVTQPNALSVTTIATADTCTKGTGTANALVSGGTSLYSYSWNNGSTNAAISSLTTGAYTVTVTDANGCSASQSVNVPSTGTAVINAGADITISGGSSATLNAAGGISYTWSPATTLSCTLCTNPVATPAVTTTYTVFGTAANGCTNLDSITVFVETPCITESLEKLLPNAFSPNADGKNDVFCVPNNACIIEFTLKIYDRWGEKVFETTSFNNCWDGYVNNKEVNTATFTYAFRARLSNGESLNKNGTISLVK